MKKRKKKSIKKQLENRCENLWKEVCRLRDGECQGPKIEKNHQCGGCLQVDHCFSRAVKELFLDPRNGTLICQNLHVRKTNKVKGADKWVDEFVRKREGDEWWAYAKRACESKTPYIRGIIELEQNEINLKELRGEMMETVAVRKSSEY